MSANLAPPRIHHRSVPYGRVNPMSPRQIREAARLWFDGFDTKDISKSLMVHESVIVTAMDRIRHSAQAVN
jgi:hypothetical protein